MRTPVGSSLWGTERFDRRLTLSVVLPEDRSWASEEGHSEDSRQRKQLMERPRGESTWLVTLGGERGGQREARRSREDRAIGEGQSHARTFPGAL